jgi:hypothetical protein
MSPSTTTVSVSDVAVSLEAASPTEHVLVLATPQGTLRVQGTVAEIRQAAQFGLSMPIPPLPVASGYTPAAAASPAASGDEARFARIEEALASLTQIAQAAQRRGLI